MDDGASPKARWGIEQITKIRPGTRCVTDIRHNLGFQTGSAKGM